MAQTKKADSKAPAFYLYSVLQTIQKTDYNLSCCIRDSVCTEWTGYNATRKESGKELWPNKNILNSATPGSIWFLFIPLLTPFPPVKRALNTSARWPQDSSPNMKGPLSVPGVVWLTLWEWCVRGRESERDTDVYIRDQICVPFTKAKKKKKKQPQISELQINHGAIFLLRSRDADLCFQAKVWWRKRMYGSAVHEGSRKSPKSEARELCLA